MFRDFYDLFGVDEDAETKELKKAYRETIREYHPDISDRDDATEKFKAVRKAYEVLEDASEREKYDKLGHHKYVNAYLGDDVVSVFDFEEPPEEEPEPRRGITTKQVRRRRNPEERWRDNSVRPPDSSPSSGRRYTAREDSTPADIPFRPRIRHDLLTSVIVIALSLSLYILGVHTLLTTYAYELNLLVSSLYTDSNLLVGLQNSMAQGRFGLPIPTEYIDQVLQDPVANLIALTFPIGMLLLPFTFSVIVYKFGDSRTWWYVVGVMTPLFGAAFNLAGIPLAPHIEAVLYIFIPIITALVFFADLSSFILLKFARYYKRAYIDPHLGEK